MSDTGPDAQSDGDIVDTSDAGMDYFDVNNVSDAEILQPDTAMDVLNDFLQDAYDNIDGPCIDKTFLVPINELPGAELIEIPGFTGACNNLGYADKVSDHIFFRIAAGGGVVRVNSSIRLAQTLDRPEGWFSIEAICTNGTDCDLNEATTSIGSLRLGDFIFTPYGNLYAASIFDNNEAINGESIPIYVKRMNKDQGGDGGMYVYVKDPNKFFASNPDFSHEVDQELHPKNEAFTLIGKIPVPNLENDLDGMATVAEVNLDSLRLEISERIFKTSNTESQSIVQPDEPTENSHPQSSVLDPDPFDSYPANSQESDQGCGCNTIQNSESKTPPLGIGTSLATIIAITLLIRKYRNTAESLKDSLIAENRKLIERIQAILKNISSR